MDYIADLPWSLVILMCLTLGLAPFKPPHIWKKLQMLKNGELKKPIDWFDLLMHSAPWAVLLIKGVLVLTR